MYSHYKGGVYQVLGIVTAEANNQQLVTYRDIKTNKIWARPLIEWDEVVKNENTPRYVLYSDPATLGDESAPIEVPFALDNLPALAPEVIDKSLNELVVAVGKTMASFMVVAQIPAYIWGSFVLDINGKNEQFELTFRRKTGKVQTA